MKHLLTLCALALFSWQIQQRFDSFASPLVLGWGEETNDILEY